MEIPYSGTAQRPPTLDGSNYAIWKVRIRVYIKSIDERAWQRVLQGWNPPRRTDGEGDFPLKPETEWNAEETAASNMNNKALNAIFTALDSNMFSLVTNCVCAKQAWEKLQMHCEGSDSVHQTKRRILTTQFENLRMEESETIDNYERRLRKIKNEAIDLGDAISNERLVSKVLRSLPEIFQIKICAIDESKDTSILGLDKLMSSLQTYELEMNGVNESDLGDDSIAFLTKQFGTYLKRMRDSKKPGQKPKVLNTPVVGKPLRIGGPEQNTIPSKSQNRFQNEGKTLNNSKRFESVKCHECTGFGHFDNECPTKLRKGMSASLSDDEDEEGTEQGDDETHNALLVLVQQKNSVVTGVPTLGHNTDQKLFCLNASVSRDSNQESGEVELSWDNAQKMYEELYNDWILRNKTNSALTKENSELKASVARLEVVLSKKDLELGKVKEELGRSNATLAKYNSSKTKLDSILMMGKDDRAGLGFHNSKFEVGKSSQTVFVKENSNSASVPIAIPKEKPISLKAQAPVQKKNQRKRRFVCHYCHKQGHIKPYCFKLRYDYMYWNSRQELSSVLPTLNQNTARRKNTEKKVWVSKAKSSCNVVYTSLKTNVAGHWYFDSGSSRHMTGLKKYLSDYVEQDKGKVTYGGGANGKIVGKDTLNIEGLPKLHNNLCQVFDKSNSCVLTGTRSSDNCYQLGEEIACKFTKVDDLNLWHQKLGHANFKALKKLSKYEAVRGMPNLTSGVPYVCGDCQKDLKGKTIEDHIDDLLDTVAPQTDSSVVNSVVPPEKSPSTTLSPTLTMDEQNTEDQDDFEHEIQDAGHDVPSKIQKKHPTSQIIGDAQGRMQTRRKEKVDYRKMSGHMKTPMGTNEKMCKDSVADSVDNTLYRSIIGRTLDLGLWYSNRTNTNLIGYSDADWAGDVDERKSTMGGCFYLGNNLVSWYSRKQNCVSLSTAESEYVAAGSCCSQLI
ncbi:uncharacterized protein [Henckelia pumila]|uniref:uncharacterized protein n=1 Tax=Henckelia pumila TaxID=405737 RepID=UPI003C6DC26D